MKYLMGKKKFQCVESCNKIHVEPVNQTDNKSAGGNTGVHLYQSELGHLLVVFRVSMRCPSNIPRLSKEMVLRSCSETLDPSGYEEFQKREKRRGKEDSLNFLSNSCYEFPSTSLWDRTKDTLCNL
jgi:hypothetical protein